MVWCGHGRLSGVDAGAVRGGHGGQSGANEDGVDTGDSVVWTQGTVRCVHRGWSGVDTDGVVS